jgi:hypothetical protein
VGAVHGAHQGVVRDVSQVRTSSRRRLSVSGKCTEG